MELMSYVFKIKFLQLLLGTMKGVRKWRKGDENLRKKFYIFYGAIESVTNVVYA